jgi:hypothetical protein
MSVKAVIVRDISVVIGRLVRDNVVTGMWLTSSVLCVLRAGVSNSNRKGAKLIISKTKALPASL